MIARADANALLVYVLAGCAVPYSEVLFALWATGDLFAGREWHA